MDLLHAPRPMLPGTPFVRESAGGRERLRIPPVPREQQLLAMLGAFALGPLLHAHLMWGKSADGLFETALLWFTLVAVWLPPIVYVAWRIARSVTLEVERGALVVTRWIGPLRLAKRYSASRITGLASKIAAGHGGFLDKERPGDGLFAKARYCAVQFDHDGKAAGIAPGYDEEAGDRIVDWLRGKLPAGAFTCPASPPDTRR